MCVEPVPSSHMDKFFHELTGGNEMDSEMLVFAREILGMKKYPQVLFVRECYKELYAVVMGLVTETEKKRGKGEGDTIFTVFGTPGVGKTVFGLYALYRLLTEVGATVMYYHGGADVYYLLGPSDSAVLAAARESGFDIQPSASGSVYIGRIIIPPTVERRQTLVHFLEEQDELFYVHDPPKSGIEIREDVRCKVLVVSSPHRGDKNALKNLQLMLYMPPWSRAELKAGNELLGVRLSEDVLEQRWNTYGGVARWALAASPDTGVQIMAEARRKLTEHGIARVLNPFGDHEGAASGAKDISGLVVHMCPTEDFRDYTIRISTPAML
jgi:hypothetical protein